MQKSTETYNTYHWAIPHPSYHGARRVRPKWPFIEGFDTYRCGTQHAETLCEGDDETGEWKEVDRSMERAPQVARAFRGGEVCHSCGQNARNLCMKPWSTQEAQIRVKHTLYTPKLSLCRRHYSKTRR